MSKAVLISIKPKWCELIASGKKTVEIRKTKPNAILPLKCYIYCTKPSFPHEDFLVFDAGTNKFKAFYGGGKVIGEFVCERIIDWSYIPDPDESADPGSMAYDILTKDGERTCLEYDDIEAYGKGAPLYGWFISDLVIYDEPKELSEFTKPCPKGHNCATCSWYFPGIQDYGRCEPPCCGFWESDDSMIARPPQSWCYVEELSVGQ